MAANEDEYFLPLEDQRVFGAGIKRKRVQFVPSSETQPKASSAPATTASTPHPDGTSITPEPSSLGDKYLSIVLSKSTSPSPSLDPSTVPATAHGSPSATEDTTPPTCDICNLPLSEPPPATAGSKYPPHPHESSLVHQASLPHSHPPSAIDRTRPGYKYLSSYGWDPDSRAGLGPTGSGIRVPVRARVKHDTAGLGLQAKQMSDAERREREKRKIAGKLNAKQVRKREEEGKRKGERLREMFYRSDDLDKYLGGG
ncbi:predicted protein [Uncinocarpus reesii 1704]|uniref:G-patch domain-containing protein n=1 Tax=Uncinocarpus reesii (strain UAMH 1704) TaxID=336963 RepID=C4JDK7_UNCRE|nr:uncharacterized protein UREG_00716 [Uncinocarpus reesii 1704]EEP75869.1 predicted protein [Uncinocarpus reesii 1704]